MSFHVFISLCFCLLYFNHKHLFGVATHSSPRTPNLRGASQAQHDMKAKSSGGDLVGYKKKKKDNTSFTLNCCSGITAKGHYHYSGALLYLFNRCYFSNNVIQHYHLVIQRSTTAF